MPGKRAGVILTAAAVIIPVFCLVLALLGGEAEKTEYSGRVTVAVLPENSGTDKLTLDIQIPVISGLEDKRFEKELNRKINAQVYTARNAAEQAADKFWRQAKEENFEPWPYIFYVGYEVKSADVIFSLKVTTLLYTGGPGMPQTIYYNVDIKKNKLIKLSDMFRNEGYVQKINSVILGEMDKDIGRYVSHEEFPGVSERTKFFISDGKLYIAFDKYEVASGMTGEPEFLIPAKVIRNLIRDEYRKVLK